MNDFTNVAFHPYTLKPCPICRNSADLYQVDAAGREWRIDCQSQWVSCDFFLSGSSKHILWELWNGLER